MWRYLDEDVDVVCDLERHHFDLVLVTQTQKFVSEVLYSRTLRTHTPISPSSGDSVRYLLRLQSVPRLALQSYSQLSDVNLQASGKVL